MKTENQLIQEAYAGMVSEGKFVQTHLASGKPNPNHPAFAKHKADYNAKQIEIEASTFSLKNKDKDNAKSKAPEENPVKMHHIDDAIGTAYPDIEPYDHLAQKFPSLHKQTGKNGSKLIDLANKAVRDNTKYKSFNDYVDDSWKQFKSDFEADK